MQYELCFTKSVFPDGTFLVEMPNLELGLGEPFIRKLPADVNKVKKRPRAVLVRRPTQLDKPETEVSDSNEALGGEDGSEEPHAVDLPVVVALVLQNFPAS